MSHWLFQPPTSFANYRAGGTGVAAATPIFWLFQGLNKKKFENQTKIGRLAAISNFCLILFISSKNSFCKTVCFLGPNPKFNFMRSLQFFQRSQQKRLSNSTVLEQFQIKLFIYSLSYSEELWFRKKMVQSLSAEMKTVKKCLETPSNEKMIHVM